MPIALSGIKICLGNVQTFWANPNYVFENEATTGTFQWNDVQFFMVDNRWFRTPNDNHTGERDFWAKNKSIG
jgi:alkaline phosphatase D